jgi:hypothetical protein
MKRQITKMLSQRIEFSSSESDSSSDSKWDLSLIIIKTKP